MNRMSCSMTTTASRWSRILQIRSIGRRGLLRVHARGRLVEEQELRVGGQRPGDLEAALVAVGHVAGELVASTCRSPTKSSSSWAALAGSRLLAPELRPAAWIDGERPREVRQWRPTMTFSSAVMLANSRMFWKVRAMPGAATTARGFGGRVGRR